ncbi:MAG: hypothetical protein KDH99_05910 [Alcanivoracaceae bacterium]|nr:hypothetical protein [Alcanivoracaceae bacterium]
MLRIKFFVLLVLPLNVWATGLQPMDEEALGNVTGQEGIALDLELRQNTDADGNPLASLGNCSGVGNPCILAVQFNNRTDLGGEWLVAKDFYGLMRFNDLWLDGADTPNGASPYSNPGIFRNGAGDCLLTGSNQAGCIPNYVPALMMHFPGTYATFEEDIEIFLNIGRMSVQYGANGFLPSSDDGESFLSLRISDLRTSSGVPNPPAVIDIDGGIKLIGF